MSVLRLSTVALMVCGGNVLLVSSALAESGADYDYFSEILTITASESAQPVVAADAAPSLSAPEPEAAPVLAPAAKTPSAGLSWPRGADNIQIPDTGDTPAAADLAARALADVVNAVGRESDSAAPAAASAAGDMDSLFGSALPAMADEQSPSAAPSGGEGLAGMVEAVAEDSARQSDDSAAISAPRRRGPAARPAVPAGDVAGLIDGVAAELEDSPPDAASIIREMSGETAMRQDKRAAPTPEAAVEVAAPPEMAKETADAPAGAQELMEQLFGERPLAAPEPAFAAVPEPEMQTHSNERLPRVLTRSARDLELGRIVDAVGSETPAVTARQGAATAPMIGDVSSVMDLTPPQGLPPPTPSAAEPVDGEVSGTVADLIGEAPGGVPSADDAIQAILGKDRSATGAVREQRVPRSGAIVDEEPVVIVTAVEPVPRSPIKPQQSEEKTRQQINKNLLARPSPKASPPPAADRPMVRKVDDAALNALLGISADTPRPSAAQVARSGARVSDADMESSTPTISGLSRPDLSRPRQSMDSAEQVIRDVVALVSNTPLTTAPEAKDFAAPARRSQPPAPSPAAVAGERQRQDVLASLSRDNVSRRAATPSRKMPPANSGIYVFGPTRPGARLEEVADILIPAENISLEQMMWALYRKNPRAFVRGNINRLKEFYILDVPHPDEIYRVSHEEARTNLNKVRNNARASRF